MAEIFLILLGSYLGCGAVFAGAFAFFGAGRVDPHAAQGSWGFRVLVIPGAAALWPILLRRWVRGMHEPPEQCDPHRRAARDKMRDSARHHLPI